MLCQTRGIVLRYIKFRETSIITTVYTEEFGIQSYIVNGIRSSRSRRGIAYFQALNLLDMVVYHQSAKNIQRLSEWKSGVNLLSLYMDIRKSSIAVFLSEIIYKTVREGEANPDMFEFIYNSIAVLENLESNMVEFHLQFMVKLARYLGYGTENYVSVVNNKFEVIFDKLLTSPYGEKPLLEIEERKETLEYLIRFYRDQTEGFGELKSYKILKELFSN